MPSHHFLTHHIHDGHERSLGVTDTNGMLGSSGRDHRVYTNLTSLLN
jgi:hypothetical protein